MDTNQETNRERLPQKQAAQGKGGSETDAKGQKADGTNKPDSDKKPRKTKAERLKELLEDQAELAKDIAELKATIAGATSKDALRLMEKLGEACFKALASQEPVELCKLLEQLLRKNMGAKDQAWYEQYGKALLAQGLPMRLRKSGDSGNNAGAQENNGKATTGDSPAKP
jgi:hypothetical protein